MIDPTADIPPTQACDLLAPPRAWHLVAAVPGTARLVDYMKDRLAVVPVTEIGDLITRGFVNIRFANVEVPGRTFDAVANGDAIAIDTGALASLEAASRWNPPWDHALTVLHEDDDVIVIDKAAGVHVHPLGSHRDATLVNALVHLAGARTGRPWAEWRPHVVQRLDCAVSGLLVVAKNAASKAALVRAQKKREFGRGYCAMVKGRIAGERGVIDAPVGREPGRGYRRAVVAVGEGGRQALTRWSVVRRFDDRTLVELHPETGRTHQIRVHLATIGHPIVDDLLYANDSEVLRPSGIGRNAAESAIGTALRSDRVEPSHDVAISLHATHLSFRHPRNGAVLDFRSPLPLRFASRSTELDGPAHQAP